MDEVVELVARVAELERRFAQTIVHGRVAEINTEEAWVRLDLGESSAGGKFLSPKVPYGQIAGAQKYHNPPSVDQQMTMFAPGGDWQQAVAIPMTWSDENASPSTATDEHVMTFGDVTVTLKSDAVILTIGGTKWTLTADGYVQNGGEIEHDGHLIDKTHVHTEVVPGAGLSGPPPGGG